jgi:hypothetical protein
VPPFPAPPAREMALFLPIPLTISP